MLSSSALHYVISNEDVAVDPVPPLNGDQPAETVIDVPVQEVPTPENTPAAIVSPVDSPSAAQVVAPDTVVSTEPAQPVDIQMVVETQNPTAMLGQATQESGFCQEQADNLLAMQQACEHYGKLLRQTGLEGISEEGAAFMQVGLKLIQRTLGTELQVSKESFDTITPRSSRMKVTISAEGIKEMASKAYDAFIEAIKKLVALIEKGWDQLKDFGINQEKSIDDKLERLKKIKVNAVSEEITVRSPALLFANGEEVFPETKALFGLAHFAFTAYPKAMETYYKDLARYVRGISKSAEDDDLSYEEVAANVDALGKPLEALSSAPGINSKFNGNHVIDISGDGLSFGIKQGDGKDAPDEVTLVVEAPVKIRKMLEQLRLINNLIVDYRPSNERVHRAAEQLLKDAEGVKDANVNKKLLQVVKDSSPRNREIAHFVGKVTRAYLAVIDKMIAKHEAVKAK